jgi:hypothetical protein
MSKIAASSPPMARSSPNTPTMTKRKIATINAGTEEFNGEVTIFELSFMDVHLEKCLGTLSQPFDARLSLAGSPIGPPHRCLVVATAFGFLFAISRSMDV